MKIDKIQYAQEENDISKIAKLEQKLNEAALASLTGNVISDIPLSTIDESKISQTAELIIDEAFDSSYEEIEVEYETSAPKADEENLSDLNKRITISADLPYENVLAFTAINDAPKEAIKLYWIKNGIKELFNDVAYYDLNENGLVDYIEWVVPHLSNQTFEVSITILNVQSYPTVGGNWTVLFNTTGIGNLTITTSSGTSYAEYFDDNSITLNDLDILELKCGDTILFNKFDNINDAIAYLIDENNNEIKINDTIGKKIKLKALFFSDYNCDNSTGYCTVKVLTSGKHTQQFNFSNVIAYANNFAFNQTSAGWFVGGTFENTTNASNNVTLTFNTSLPVNYPNQSGRYISQVFDAGANAQWTNISWGEEVPYQEEIGRCVAEDSLITVVDYVIVENDWINNYLNACNDSKDNECKGRVAQRKELLFDSRGDASSNAIRKSRRAHTDSLRNNEEKEEKQARSLDKDAVRLTRISHEFFLDSETAESHTLKDNSAINYLNVSLSRLLRF